MKKSFIFTLLISAFLSACNSSPTPVSPAEPSSTDLELIQNEESKVEENILGKDYRFTLPKGWQEMSTEGRDEKELLMFYNPSNQDKIEIQTLVDVDHPEASVESRQEYLERVIQRGDEKMEVKGGEIYYFLNETAEGNFPSAYLFGVDNVFLVSFNSSLSFPAAEEWFKDFILTFNLTN